MAMSRRTAAQIQGHIARPFRRPQVCAVRRRSPISPFLHAAHARARSAVSVTTLHGARRCDDAANRLAPRPPRAPLRSDFLAASAATARVTRRHRSMVG